MPRPLLTIDTTFDLANNVMVAGRWADEIHATGDADDAEGHELIYSELEPLTPLPDSPRELSSTFLRDVNLFSDSPLSTPPSSPPYDSSDKDSNPLTSHPTLASNRPFTKVKAKRVAAAKDRKQRKRVANAKKNALQCDNQRKTSSERYVQAAQKSWIAFEAKSLHHTANAYYGSRNRDGLMERLLSEEELLQDGWERFPWDGRSTVFFVDPQGRIIVILIGQPQDAEWPDVIKHCASRLKQFRELGAKIFGHKWRKHRRGLFLALPYGVSYGGGQMRPGNLAYGKAARRLFRLLLDDRNIQRVAGFQSSALQTFCPKLYNYMRDKLRALYESLPNLEWNFKNSIFPSISFNCGPKTECYPHRDFGNAPHLMCVITALGSFDPKTGGKFLAHDIKKIIEFPPGSSIALPSASMTHSNTAIQPNEERYSITQYCAGGLLRWVDCGFRSVKAVLAQPAGKKALEEIDGPPGARWKWALDMFSNVSELKSGPHGMHRPQQWTKMLASTSL